MLKVLAILFAACEFILVGGIVLPIRGNRFVVPKATTDPANSFYGDDPPRDYPDTSYTPSLRDKGLFLTKSRPIYSEKYYEAPSPKEETVTKNLYTENHDIGYSSAHYAIQAEYDKIPSEILSISSEVPIHGQEITTSNYPDFETGTLGFLGTSQISTEYKNEGYSSYPSEVLSDYPSSAATAPATSEAEPEYPVLAPNQKITHFPGGYTISTYSTPTTFATHSFPAPEEETQFESIATFPKQVIYPVPVTATYGHVSQRRFPTPGYKYVSTVRPIRRRRVLKKIFRFIG